MHGLQALLAILAFTLTICPIQGTVSKGVLYFHGIDGKLLLHTLGYRGIKVAVTDRNCYIEHDETGALYFVEANRYLRIHKNGQLYLSRYPHKAFLLTDVPGSFWMKSLAFKGDPQFQLCGDNLVRYDSVCPDAQEIALYYSLCWPFSSDMDSQSNK